MKTEAMTELYDHLIYAIAREYSYKEEDLEDLYQAGSIGLKKAMDNYKEGYNAKFSSYAHFYIRGEISKCARENRVIKMSPELAKLSRSIRKVKDYLAQKYMREPTIEEISIYLEEDPVQVERAIMGDLPVKSLDYELNGDEEGKDVNLYDYQSYIEKGYDEDILMLKEELEKLPPQERQLIMLRYYQDKSQSETSKELGMNQVQVSRTEKKILRKIRTNIEREAA